MAYAAITQHLIYAAGPCYDAPLACPAANETTPNSIHVAVQTPAYFLIALSEIFASITGLEYAFTKAPPSMKSFVMSIFLLQTAFGSALGIALAPTATDPKLVWMYSESAFLYLCFIKFRCSLFFPLPLISPFSPTPQRVLPVANIPAYSLSLLTLEYSWYLHRDRHHGGTLLVSLQSLQRRRGIYESARRQWRGGCQG